MVAVGVGAGVAVSQMGNDDSEELTILSVPENAVTISDDCEQISASDCVQLRDSTELPYGSLVWANDDSIAACLIPTEQTNPLATVALINLDTTTYIPVLSQAVGADYDFEIYDVRASSSGVIWTEANILEGIWRIYTATFDGEELGVPVQVDEGDSNWQTPTLTACGNRMFWQVLPNLNGSKTMEESLLKVAEAGSDDVEVVYRSNGRMATPPYGLTDGVVITPRTDTDTVHYQLTFIDAKSGDVRDTLVLPTSMHPLEAGYGETGFMFSFEDIYDYGDGIANLGTYVPAQNVTNDDYSNVPWFRFARTPTAAPAWCGPFLIVKSLTSVCGVDLNTDEYFALDVESGADSYGEYLATTGVRSTIVTFTNIDESPVNDDDRHCCLVKIWEPVVYAQEYAG